MPSWHMGRCDRPADGGMFWQVHSRSVVDLYLPVVRITKISILYFSNFPQVTIVLLAAFSRTQTPALLGMRSYLGTSENFCGHIFLRLLLRYQILLPNWFWCFDTLSSWHLWIGYESLFCGLFWLLQSGNVLSGRKPFCYALSSRHFWFGDGSAVCVLFGHMRSRHILSHWLHSCNFVPIGVRILQSHTVVNI